VRISAVIIIKNGERFFATVLSLLGNSLRTSCINDAAFSRHPFSFCQEKSVKKARAVSALVAVSLIVRNLEKYEDKNDMIKKIVNPCRFEQRS